LAQEPVPAIARLEEVRNIIAATTGMAPTNKSSTSPSHIPADGLIIALSPHVVGGAKPDT